MLIDLSKQILRNNRIFKPDVFESSFKGFYTRSPDFIIRVKTDNAGSSNNDQFILPVKSGLTYDYTIAWGDGTVENITSDANQTHTYPAAGTYIIRIRGTFPRIFCLNHDDRQKIIGVLQWGDIAWGDLSYAIWDCNNLVEVPQDGAPNLSGVTRLTSMFNSCGALTRPPNMSAWDMSNIEEPHYIFNNCSNMTTPPDVSGWDTSSCTDMRNMFYSCPIDVDISNFNISSLTDASDMMNGSNFSQENYDKFLIAAAAQAPSIQSNVSFHAGSAYYSAGGDAADAHDLLTDDFSWTLTDSGSR